MVGILHLAGDHDDDHGNGADGGIDGGADGDYDNSADGGVDVENDITHQNLSLAGEGGDMEGNVGEDEQGVGVLRKLLQPGHVVLTSEGQVDQEAKVLR